MRYLSTESLYSIYLRIIYFQRQLNGGPPHPFSNQTLMRVHLRMHCAWRSVMPANLGIAMGN